VPSKIFSSHCGSHGFFESGCEAIEDIACTLNQAIRDDGEKKEEKILRIVEGNRPSTLVLHVSSCIHVSGFDEATSRDIDDYSGCPK
jgi:hypothetical protein